MLVQFTCEYCGKLTEKQAGHLNRARKLGAPVYCNQICSGLARRVNRTIEEKKAIKSAYDKAYHRLNPEKKRAASKEYHEKNYDSAKQKIYNKKRYPEHLKYLQRPEYKAYKKQYDEAYRAAKIYGEFSEAFLVLKKLEIELDSKQIKYDTGITINKSNQKRKRQWQRNQQQAQR